MGTPQFAVPILNKLSEKHEIVLVVTQPDQYNSRKKTVIYSPVKQWALDNNIEVFQPLSIRKDYQKILETQADIIITAAYGQIVGTKILNYPKYKAINVHGSLLPKYRGGAPIQRSIINGDKETGITIMYMDRKMDAGDILLQRAIPITESDTQDSMFEKLSILGSEMIEEVLEGLVNETLEIKKQDEKLVSYAYNLTKEDELINFNNTAYDVFNQIRGLNSNPGAYFLLEDIQIKVYNSRVADYSTNMAPGNIVKINKKCFDISCKDGTVISILEIQLPSKNKINASDFINGSGRKLLSVGAKVN